METHPRNTADSGFFDPLYVIKEIAENTLHKLRTENQDAHELLAKANAALSETMQQVSRVIQMIDHLRSLGSGPRKNALPPASGIHDCVHNVLRAMQYEFPLSNITVLKILPHDLLPAPIAREHLETILFQLIYQARERILKENRPGIISIEAAEKICLSPENQSQRRFQLRVSNNGPELSKEELPHVFDPFSGSAGSFGLYVTKKITDYYSGTISVETSGKTTSFNLEFPA